MIDLKNAIIKIETPKNETQNKINDIVENVHDFNKKQNCRGLKILTPKLMLQRLPISLPQVKAGNTSKNLLNEIRQIIYSLY